MKCFLGFVYNICMIRKCCVPPEGSLSFISHCWAADKNKDEYYNSLFQKRPDEDREKMKFKDCKLSRALPPCQCSWKSLFCENRGLKKLPKYIPTDVKELYQTRYQQLRYNPCRASKLMNDPRIDVILSKIARINKLGHRRDVNLNLWV
ncbi:hypothetical protein CEXT_57871 [Caerostris extrusa]|uniref:Uncharacterized protein n=1 Tax=Caerostris extrusa TaxID=172846 RepID=A0AAV4PKW3_CAEEX|nr:hypothetical protein CEXT_57871 [Caerostris extrusa]